MSNEDGSKTDEKPNILYQDNVSNLKTKYRSQRIYSIINTLIPQIIIFLVLSFFLGFYALLGFIFGMIFFLPTPLPPAPKIYGITNRGIVIGNKERRIFNNKRHGFKINEKEMYVSITHSWRGELVRLYSHEPRKLYDLLISLKRESKTEKRTGVMARAPRKKLSIENHKTGYKPINMYLKRIPQTIRRTPPLIFLILASILAFFGLITGNLTVSITAQSIFFISMITWGIWLLYKRIRAKTSS